MSTKIFGNESIVEELAKETSQFVGHKWDSTVTLKSLSDLSRQLEIVDSLPS